MGKYEKAQMSCDKALARAESMPSEQKVRAAGAALQDLGEAHKTPLKTPHENNTVKYWTSHL